MKIPNRPSRNAIVLGALTGVFGLASRVQAGDTPAGKAPAVAVNLSYEDALTLGDALMNKKDAKGAAKAFAAAVAAKPGDGRALSELSFAATVAGDYATARTAAEKAIAAATSPNLKAASYYNLGRAKEGAADLPGARAAYEESLKLRETKEVRARLVRLGGAKAPAGAPAAPDPFVRHALAGPYARLEDFCQTQSQKQNLCQVTTNLEVKPGKLALGAPFLGLALVTSDRPSASWPGYHLGLKLAGGWYVMLDVADAGNRHSLEFTDVKMVGERLLLRYDYNEGRFDWTHDAGVLVCGLGSTGQPSCLGPLATYHESNEHQGGKEDGSDTLTIEYSCTAELLPGDVLQVRPGPKKPFQVLTDKVKYASPTACDRLPIFGTHKLLF